MAGALRATALLLVLCASAQAQTADSTVSSAAATPAAELPAPALPRPPLALPEAPPGRPVAPVPAITPALSIEALLPGFDYALGAPGRSAGASLDGLDPNHAALFLDGRPFDDLITGAPRPDLLPLAALAPLRLSDGRVGAPVSIEAATRAFRLGVPVTELRYLAGQSGVQDVSATHAQTRLPPAFLRGGSRDSRFTVAGTVMSRRGQARLAGADLRQTDLLIRSLLTRPGLATDVGIVYTDRTDGARRGVVPGAADDIFSLNAEALGADATRRTLRTEAYATARLRLVAPQPATVTIRGVTQRLVYAAGTSVGAGDTLRVHARRAEARLVQPLGRTLHFRSGAAVDLLPAANAGALGTPRPRLRLDAALRDSVALGGAQATLEGGAALIGGAVVPFGSVRIARGASAVGARVGGSGPGPVEASGLIGSIAGGNAATERTLVVDAETRLALGAASLGLRAFGTARTSARLLVARDTLFTVETAPGPLAALGLTARLGLRDGAARGVYAHATATARAPLRADASALARRDADALPRLWADVRAGTRASGIGDGVLDLDLAVVGRAWTAFRSRLVEPTTGLLALPDPASDLGQVLPARGTLGVEATATFSRRATVFLQLDHALGQAVGATVVQGEPLAPRVLRFGVFWALLD